MLSLVLAWLEGGPRGKQGLAVMQQGKSVSAACAPAVSLLLSPKRERTCKADTCQDAQEGLVAGAIFSCAWYQPQHFCSTPPGNLLYHRDPHGHCCEQKKQRLFNRGWILNLMLFIPCLPHGGMIGALPWPLLCSGLPLGSEGLCFSFSTGSDCKGPSRSWEGGVEGNSLEVWGQVGQAPLSHHAGSPGHGQGNLPQLQPSLEFVCWLKKCLEILLDERHCINVSTCHTPGSTSLDIKECADIPHLEHSLQVVSLHHKCSGNSNGSNSAPCFI